MLAVGVRPWVCPAAAIIADVRTMLLKCTRCRLRLNRLTVIMLKRKLGYTLTNLPQLWRPTAAATNYKLQVMPTHCSIVVAQLLAPGGSDTPGGHTQTFGCTRSMDSAM